MSKNAEELIYSCVTHINESHSIPNVSHRKLFETTEEKETIEEKPYKDICVSQP